VGTAAKNDEIAFNSRLDVKNQWILMPYGRSTSATLQANWKKELHNLGE
jgi:inner membrane protein involved in colicin E2 resistance